MASSRKKRDPKAPLTSAADLLTVLNELDDSDLGDDEIDEPSPDPKPNYISGNWSDDTDEDPDFNPENEEETSSDDCKPSTSNKNAKRRKTQPASTQATQADKGGSTSQKGKKGKGKITPPKKGAKGKAKKKEKDLGPPWRKGHFQPSPLSLSQPSYPPVNTDDWTADTYIEQYLDYNIYSLIVDKTNQTYVFKFGKSMELTVPELKVWIGINCIMAAIQLPKIRMYWEKQWRIKLVADAMSRDRYFLIRTTLKCVFDNEITDEQKQLDRVWKVRPLIDRVLQGCMRQERDREVCIDEMMIPFTGACGIRQFVPNKPNPVGLKVFVLSNPNGIVCDLKVYEGKNTFSEERAQGFALCESAVLYLSKSLVPGHVIYFDRYFSTVKLAQELLKNGIRCSGTLMKNRIPENTDLICDKEFRKLERGSMAVTVSEDRTMAITKWMDNKAVAMLSTNESENPVVEVKRWSKLHKKYIYVKQPSVIHSYNQKMGGVDLADRMMAYCPSRARTNKWTVRCIMHFIDMSLTNAWLQMREVMRAQNVPKKDIPQFRMFKISFGQRLIENNDQSDKVSYHSSSEDDDETFADGRTSSVPSIDRRSQGAKHLPDVSTGVQKRCRQQGCSKKTSIFCLRCKAYLCLLGNRNCFKKFHTK